MNILACQKRHLKSVIIFGQHRFYSNPASISTIISLLFHVLLELWVWCGLHTTYTVIISPYLDNLWYQWIIKVIILEKQTQASKI